MWFDEFSRNVFQTFKLWIPFYKFEEEKYQYIYVLFFSILTCFVLYAFKNMTNKITLKLYKYRNRNVDDCIEVNNAILYKIHYSVRKSMINSKYIRICIKLLTDYPSAVNQPLTANNYTPFLRACSLGCEELILFMLNNGADANIHTVNGDSPVYLVTYGIATAKIFSFNPLKILINAGCSLNSKTKNNLTPLHVAAFYGNDDLVKFLLANGADPFPIHCSLPLDYALKTGNSSTANLLTINISDSNISKEE